jgi:hypothetical protein
MRLFVNDFDNNGTIEQIATRFIDGKDMPLNQARYCKQIPMIKRKFELCRLRKEIKNYFKRDHR